MFSHPKFPLILRMLFQYLIISMIFSGAACTPQPAVQTENSPTHEIFGEPEPEEFYFKVGGYRLYYDPQLVIDVQPPAELVPENLKSGPASPPYPAFAHFDLYMEQAQVYIAPVEEYKAVWDSASEIVEGLNEFISHPISHKGCIPELPLDRFFHQCGHQQFGASLAQLGFQNGHGVRFVTVYGIHDATPVDNDHLLYVFHGFTDDGAYYVKVVVRMLHDLLPQTGEIPAEIYSSNDWIEVFTYFDSLASQLESNTDGYAPDLEWVDAFIRSFRVELE